MTISPTQFDGHDIAKALRTVARKLDRGEIKAEKFNMNSPGMHCGSPACVGGWAAKLLGLENEHIYHFVYNQIHLRNLFFPNHLAHWQFITRKEAAKATRNFLAGEHKTPWLDVVKASTLIQRCAESLTE